MPWAAARSRRTSSDQSLLSWKTASGFTMFERMPCGAPSSASTFASWASAAFAAEYAAKSLPGDITFLVATKTSAPPRPWEIRTRIAARGRGDLLRRLPGAGLVEVADDDVGALGSQPLRYRSADARAAAGHQHDAPRLLLLRRRQRELVELERPVLDVVGVLGGERHVAAERRGVADDV